MAHQVSDDDRTFQQAFESCEFPLGEFNHKAHVRLGYIYLCDQDTDSAYQKMRQSLFAFLDHNGVDRMKYHVTLTMAWIKAVQYFMTQTPNSASAEDFIHHCPALLDTKVMLTHYSEQTLFSEEARAAFLEPDLDPIPEPDSGDQALF